MRLLDRLFARAGGDVPAPPEWLTVSEAALWLDLDRGTLDAAIQSGRLDGAMTRFGRTVRLNRSQLKEVLLGMARQTGTQEPRHKQDGNLLEHPGPGTGKEDEAVSGLHLGKRGPTVVTDLRGGQGTREKSRRNRSEDFRRRLEMPNAP